MAYSTALSRWMQEDPAGDVDGRNSYLPFADNPINRVDPTGLYVELKQNNNQNQLAALTKALTALAPAFAIDSIAIQHTWVSASFYSPISNGQQRKDTFLQLTIKPSTDDKEKFCQLVKAHPAGTLIVFTLLTDKKHTLQIIPQLPSFHNGQFNPQNFQGSTSYGDLQDGMRNILWNPVWPGPVPPEGVSDPKDPANRDANIAAVLGHELTHAYDWFNDKQVLDWQKNGNADLLKYMEVHASEAENQIYAEIMNKPGQRTQYSKWPVNPNAMPFTCDCDAIWKAFHGPATKPS